MTRKELTYEEWQAEGRRRFGPDPLNWIFICPSCKSAMKTSDYKECGAPSGAAGFSCVGRWNGSKRDAFSSGTGPCNYAGGGLIGINPVRVLLPSGPVDAFEFAEP